MRSSFTMLKGDCPICNGASRGRGSGKRDCRSTLEGRLVHCRTAISLGLPVPNGWRYLKDDTLGFGMFIKSDRQGDNEDYYRRQEQLRKQREERTLNLPSQHERSESYNHINEELILSQRHQNILLERGLTLNEISRLGYKTWNPRTYLRNKAPFEVAGLNKDRKQLVGSGGIALWTRDPQGRIQGAQIKTDGDYLGKYCWLTSQSVQGVTPHLPNGTEGELPLAVQNFGFDAKQVWLAEGILKTAIASLKLNKIFIGAAGGNFASSPETFASYLKQLNPEEIVIAPDAGAIENPHVSAQIRATVDLARKLGHLVKVAWWGQRTKLEADIDDLLVAGRAEEIKLISPEEYFSFEKCPEKVYQPAQRRGVQKTSVPVEAPHQEQYTAFIYKAGDRIKTWSSNIMENHKVQLDTSPVGTGKSYTVGELVEEVLPKFTTHKIILVTTDPRNVTTDTLKSWPVLEGRHDGLVEQLLENSKGGFERHIRRKKIRPSSIDAGAGAPDEQKKEVVLANCDRAELSQILIAKNVTPSADSVCTGCPFKKQCHSGSGQFNFLHQRQEVMKQQRFIAHPSALSPDTIEEGTLLIFDEASRLEWVKTYVATLGDVSRTGMELLNPDATEEETEFFDIVSRLWSLMNNSLPNEYKLYGMPHHKVLESVLSRGQAPSISVELIEQLSEQSTEYMSEYEEFYGADAQSNKALKKVRQFLQAKEQLIKQAQNMRLRWLPDFYQALMGTPGYRLHLNVDGLHITTPNKHLKALIKAEGVYSILLDATEHADFFEKVLDEKIIEVRQEEPESAKIKIVQVFGNGRCGYSRRDRQQRRQEAIIESIQAKHGKLPVIEIGKYAKEGQSKWITDSRGRNHLETAPGLIISGIASMNISAAADKFSALFGRPVNVDDRVMRTYPVLTTNTTEHWSVTLEEAQDDEFAQWYRRQTLAELHQAIGRLRATRRPGEELIIYLLTDYPIDLEVEFTRITDWISLEPTTDDRIEEAIQKLQQDNAQITTRVIASLANCAPGTVSKSKAYQSYRQTLNSLPHGDLEVIPNVHIYSTSGINQNEVELDPTKRYVMDGVEGEMILISQGNGMVVLEQSVTGMTWCANVNQVKILDV